MSTCSGRRTLSCRTSAVYIDVEGVPDRGLYYLIGLRYKDGDEDIQRSFWAENDVDERSIWLLCLRELKSLDHPRLIHYGSYESRFLKMMKRRYCESEEDRAFVDELISSSFNLLSLLHGNIYFPTYSNGLKEIAGYLGFRWSEADASGLGALLRRAEWEGSRQPDLKQKLLTYNAEDCMAAQLVARAVADICAEQPATARRGGQRERDLARTGRATPVREARVCRAGVQADQRGGVLGLPEEQSLRAIRYAQCAVLAAEAKTETKKGADQ